MSRLLVLRFRDLVTEPGGTIAEHCGILEERGHVWWGWWMRQYEQQPRELLRATYEQAQQDLVDAYLFDSGRAQLHACAIADLRTAPPGETIPSPAPEASPTYYQRGAYPAWFQLRGIDPEGLTEVPDGWTFAEFPTNPDADEHPAHVGQPVESLEQLRKTDATLWVVDGA